MPDADGEQLDLPLFLDHGDHVAQVFFQVIRGVNRQGAVIDRRAVADHHQDLARLGPARHAPVRPFQRLAVDVFLQQALFHHQPKVGPCPPPGRVGALVDDVAQIIQASGLLFAPRVQPGLAALAALPSLCCKTQNLDLDAAPLKRTRQNVGADRRNRDRPPAHRTRVVQKQGHHRIAELGVLFDLEAKRRRGVGHHPRQTARIQHALFQIELPAAVLLCLQAALQLVGQPADRALERLELLIQIGAQALQLDRLGQVLGADFFVVLG